MESNYAFPFDHPTKLSLGMTKRLYVASGILAAMTSTSQIQPLIDLMDAYDQAAQNGHQPSDEDNAKVMNEVNRMTAIALLLANALVRNEDRYNEMAEEHSELIS